MGNTRKRITELIGDVTVLLTFTGEIENSTKLPSGNKFNNGKRFFTKQPKLASISFLTNLSENVKN